jgi:hypothetical protein
VGSPIKWTPSPRKEKRKKKKEKRKKKKETKECSLHKLDNLF